MLMKPGDLLRVMSTSDGVHLAAVSTLEPWWGVVGRACPLVAPLDAELTICSVRAQLARLLVESPDALPAGSASHLLLVADALSAQAQKSHHAYFISEEEHAWALRLAEVQDPLWGPVAKALLPALSPSDKATAAPDYKDGGAVVNHFYERVPYGQWVNLDPAIKSKMAPPLRVVGEASGNVLSAGCGMGSWASHFAATFPNASVLGIDFCKNSLAYARDRQQHFGLHNLDLKWADLSGSLDVLSAREFDLIESSGVLHHLEDPVAAWQTLTQHLSPSGVMLIGLYSRRARLIFKELKAELLPQDVNEGDVLHDDDVLRRFRHALLSKLRHPSEDLPPFVHRRFWQMARSPTCHSLSCLRDVFFHPLEHEYDLPELQQILERLSLRLLHPPLVRKYTQDLFDQLMPGRDPMDLSAWHELEQQVPDVFVGMYRLFVGKV